MGTVELRLPPGPPSPGARAPMPITRTILVSLLFALAACPRPEAPAPYAFTVPPPVGSAAPVAASSPVARAEPSDGLMPEATLVVVGRVRRVTTRDGHRGSIGVDRVLRGAAGFSVAFISDPAPIDLQEQRVFFLVPTAKSDLMRALPFDGRVSGPLELVAGLEASVLKLDPPRAPGSRWAADLRVMRSHDQSVWGPKAQPVIVAAERVFGELVWVGRRTQDLTALLGPPATIEGSGTRWQYTFHNGEAGIMRTMKVEQERVVSMRVTRTE